MKKILVVYGSREGHTKRIAKYLQNQVAINNLKLLDQQLQTINPNYDIQQELGMEVETIDLNTAYNDYNLDFTKYDAVVIGSSIHYGLFPVELLALVERHYQVLNQLPSYFFSINLTARKENKNTPETNAYTRKFLAKSPWRPTASAVFAGALNYSQLSKWDARIVTFIMWMTKGDTDPTTQKVYTNWDSVTMFTSMICQQVTGQALIDYPLASQAPALSHQANQQDQELNTQEQLTQQTTTNNQELVEQQATGYQTSNETNHSLSDKQVATDGLQTQSSNGQENKESPDQDDAEFVSHLNIEPRIVATNPSEPPKL